MKPQTPGMGFFYALMMEETGKLYLIAGPVYSNFQGPGRLLVESVYRKLEKPGFGQNLYTQKSGPRQIPGPGRIQKARKAWTRAEPVYSNFQGSGRFLARGVYRKIEKSGFRQDLYTQIFRAQPGFWPIAYTTSSKSLGPRQNQYTQIFRIQAGSWSRAYTESSKSLDPGQNLYTQIFRAQAGF